MNRKTIQKVIDELSKDNPRLDYVRGILETLLESLPEEKEPIKITSLGNGGTVSKPINISTNNATIDESAMIENSAMAVLNRIDKNAIKTE